MSYYENNREICTAEIFFRILADAGIAPVRTNRHKHIDKRPADAQIKEFLGLLPLYNSLLHIVIILIIQPSRIFCRGPKTCILHGDKSRQYSACLITSHCMAFSGSFTVSATSGWAQLSTGMTVSVNECTWMYVVGMQILKGLAATVCAHCVIM